MWASLGEGFATVMGLRHWSPRHCHAQVNSTHSLGTSFPFGVEGGSTFSSVHHQVTGLPGCTASERQGDQGLEQRLETSRCHSGYLKQNVVNQHTLVTLILVPSILHGWGRLAELKPRQLSISSFETGTPYGILMLLHAKFSRNQPQSFQTRKKMVAEWGQGPQPSVLLLAFQGVSSGPSEESVEADSKFMSH